MLVNATIGTKSGRVIGAGNPQHLFKLVPPMQSSDPPPCNGVGGNRTPTAPHVEEQKGITDSRYIEHKRNRRETDFCMRRADSPYLATEPVAVSGVRRAKAAVRRRVSGREWREGCGLSG